MDLIKKVLIIEGRVN